MRNLAVYVRGFALFAGGLFAGNLVMQSSAAQEKKATALRLNHVSITVNDFQQSLNFYTKVMGFRVACAFLPTPDGRTDDDLSSG